MIKQKNRILSGSFSCALLSEAYGRLAIKNKKSQPDASKLAKDWLFLFLLFRLIFNIRYIGLGGFPDVKSAAAQDIYYPGRIIAF